MAPNAETDPQTDSATPQPQRPGPVVETDADDSVDGDLLDDDFTEKSERPSASDLEDRVPEWARLSRATALWTFLLGLLWLFFSYQPLWHTDLWGHLYYGKIIVEAGGIPATEPALPLAKGVSFYDTAWLSQVIGYTFYRLQGVTSLRFLYALCLITCAIGLVIRFRQRTDSFALPLLGLAILFGVVWKSQFVMRPQLAGYACYVLLFCLLLGRRWPRWFWVGIPALFIAWVNLHGSFPIGIGLLGLLCIGRGLDVWLRTGRFGSVVRDRRVNQLFVVTELALIAVLFNPYGLGIYPAIESIANSPNLQSLVEWDPVTLRMMHGKLFAVTAIGLMLVYRLTPRRVSLAEPLLLITFGLASLWTVRMMVWWTPLAAWFFVLHGSAILKRRERRLDKSQSLAVKPTPAEVEADEQSVSDELAETPAENWGDVRSGFSTVVTIGLLWIFFAYTPFGATLLHGYPEQSEAMAKLFKQNVSQQTPVDLTNYLHKNEPRGLVFNTYEWGDYLLWAGPAGLQLYANSHAHLLPSEIWRDYFTISQVRRGWEDKLDRYGINTVIVDHQYRSRLIATLKDDPAWTLDYEDRLGAIFLRVEPIENQPLPRTSQ